MLEHALTIVQLNDSHAYFEPHPELFWGGESADYRTAGGYSRIATVLNQIQRDTSGMMLALDGGDTFHGTYAAVKTEGEALLPVLSQLPLSAMTAHWEFAYGPDRFRQLAAQLPYPVLAINCYDKGSGQLIFPPYTVKEVGRLRVGVIGIAATIVDKTMPPSFSKGLRFTLGNEELPGYITTLRDEEHVDLVVVISHLGLPQEMKLAEEVHGIDVLLSAHTHNRLYKPILVNNTIIIQSGCHGSFLGRLDLDVRQGRITDFRHQLLVIGDNIPPDPTVQERVEHILAPYREELTQVVGYTSTALNRNTTLEATMDNLLLQSLLDISGAQVAFSNGWRYGAPILPGPITLNDLYNIIPFNPPVSTVDLTGDEIRMMLEENLEHTFARDPYHQMGGYLKRCLGLQLYFKIENSYGQRVQEIFIQGERIKTDRVYHAAFVTAQGVPERYGSNRQNLDTRAVEALRRYLASHQDARADLRGNVTAI